MYTKVLLYGWMLALINLLIMIAQSDLVHEADHEHLFLRLSSVCNWGTPFSSSLNVILIYLSSASIYLYLSICVLGFPPFCGAAHWPQLQLSDIGHSPYFRSLLVHYFSRDQSILQLHCLSLSYYGGPASIKPDMLRSIASVQIKNYEAHSGWINIRDKCLFTLCPADTHLF